MGGRLRVRVAIGGPAIGCLAMVAIVLHAGSARADACEIEGVASGITITVREADERGYRRVRLTRPTRVAFAPMRTGISSIRVLDGDSPVEGTTRAELPVVIARPISLRQGTVELPAGLPVERVRAAADGLWVVVDLALGDGVYLRRAPVPCSELAIATGDEVITALAPVEAHGPAWRARTTRLALFDREDGDQSLFLDVAPDAAARFVELDRRVPWVRVALRTSLGARLRAWVHDWDLVR